MAFYQHNINDRKSMCEQFLSINGDVKAGMSFFDRVTDAPHTMCVIDVNNTEARSYSDYVYQYKAPDKKLPKFTIRRKNRNGINLLNDKEVAIASSKEVVKVQTKVRKTTKKKPNYDTYGIGVRTAPEIEIIEANFKSLGF